MTLYPPIACAAERPGVELKDESLALPARGIEAAYDVDWRGHANGTCACLLECLRGRALGGRQLGVLSRPGSSADSTAALRSCARSTANGARTNDNRACLR